LVIGVHPDAAALHSVRLPVAVIDDEDSVVVGWRARQSHGDAGGAVGLRGEAVRLPGSYASSETEVLGLVVSRAVHMPLADYLATRIWQKLGAESDAAWYDLAIEALDEAIKLNPNSGGAFANRAEVHLKKSEYDSAAQDFDEAIRLDPNLEAVWSGRCWTRTMLGTLQAALQDCNKALQSEPNNAATYDSRGLIYLKMGQLGAAIDDYTSALRFAPKLASALYGRELAKLKQGDAAGSDADMSAAKTIQGNIGDDFARYGVR
jgi:tetratricopeptide (TPR) repeat protein